MTKIRYQLQDINSTVITCNLSDDDKLQLSTLTAVSEKINFNRRGQLKNDKGRVFAFTNDHQLVKSSKIFKEMMQSILDSIEYIQNTINVEVDKNNRQTARLLHNLTTLNAHNIQEIFSIIPQDIFSQTYGKVANIEKIVHEDARDTALALLRMSKNNTAMKVEFSVFNKLYADNNQLRKNRHNIHRVLLNIFYPFFPEFTDKGVRVSVCQSNEHGFFDYESMHVALFHIIDNAAKYTKIDTELNISIKRITVTNQVEIVFTMFSLAIQDNEKQSIFKEGVSGKLARKIGKAGSGIGMSRAKELIKLNNGVIYVEPDEESAIETLGILYQKNKITILLPRK